jgi:aldehyde dehydrogenase (NAD+)
MRRQRALLGGRSGGSKLDALWKRQHVDYGKQVTIGLDLGDMRHRFCVLVGLLDSGTVFHGGQHDRNDRFIAPTVLVNVSTNSPAKREEIFGPILPVLEVGTVGSALHGV